MKKRMKNKMVSIFLVGAMALSACACGSTSPQQEDTAVKESAGNAVESEAVQTTGAEETSGEYVPSYPICAETITITAQGQSTGHTDEWSSTIQFEEYEKRLGIKIETENVYDSETWASKRSLLFASDELPDLLLNSQLTVSEVQAYGKDGYFLDLSQYLDVMPNFKAYMEEYPEWADAMTNENGEIFAILGLNTRSAYALYGIQLINNQWLENLNLEKPETLDELYTVLKVFKDEDANLNGDPDDEIPLLVRSGSSILQTILWGHGIYARKNYFNIQADDNGKVFLADTTDNYREFLKYINKLYTEGLINQDMFTITSDECYVIEEEGLAGAFSDHSTFIDVMNPEPDDWYEPVGFTGPLNEDKTAVINSRVGQYAVVAVNANTEYPEEIAKFIDYMFTEEGIVSSANGYEGTSFDWVENVPGLKTTDSTVYMEKEGYASANEYRAQRAVTGTMQIVTSNIGTFYGYLDGLSEEELLSSVADYDIHPLRCLALKDSDVVLRSVFPSLAYTSEEATVRSAKVADISAYCKATYAQFITGELDIYSDDVWNAHIKKIEDMGLAEMLEIDQTAYDRYCGK